MTTTFRVYFDGKVLVPEQPIDLPVGQALEVQVQQIPADKLPGAPLAQLASLAKCLPHTSGPATDRAAQHDHYLYGHPKRP